MSSYIVDDSTINRILAAAELYTETGWLSTPPSPPHLVSSAPGLESWAALGSSMRAMNVAAVIARYGPSDSLPGPDPLLPYQYESIMAPSPIQAIKSLDCYLYQCSEGDVPKETLYQQLTQWRGDLCSHQVSQSDAYEAAEWG